MPVAAVDSTTPKIGVYNPVDDQVFLNAFIAGYANTWAASTPATDPYFGVDTRTTYNAGSIGAIDYYPHYKGVQSDIS